MSDLLDEILLNIDATTANEVQLDDEQIAELLGDDDVAPVAPDAPEAADPEEVDPEEPAEVSDVEVLENVPEAPLEDDEGFDDIQEIDAEYANIDVPPPEDPLAAVREILAQHNMNLEEDSDGVEVMEEEGTSSGEDGKKNGDQEEVMIESDEGEGEGEEEVEEEAIEGDGEGTSTRKRAATNGTAPGAKRRRSGPSQPSLAARNSVIKAMTEILGSWEFQVNRSNLKTLKDLHLTRFAYVSEQNQKQINALKTEVLRLKGLLHDERQSHGQTLYALKELGMDAQKMRKQVEELSLMVTQPRCITIMDDVAPTAAQVEKYHREQNGREKQQQQQQSSSHQQRQRDVYMSPQRQHQMRMQQDPIMRQRLEMNGYGRPEIEQRRRLHGERQIYQQQNTPQHYHNSPQVTGPPFPRARARTSTAAAAQALLRNVAIASGIPLPQPPVRVVIPPPGPGQPKWQQIPPPPVLMGHSDGIPNPDGPQKLIDCTRANDNIIKLHIPFVPVRLIISSGDSARLPSNPRCFSGMPHCPDLSIVITSSQADFRDNWQIAGKINYEYLGDLDDTKIQIFVQVASMKFSGINGIPNPDMPNAVIDWGISNSWGCKAKSHKFRVVFHHRQQIPMNDRITVMVAARNENTGITQISPPVFMQLQ
ncbi:hypothetical protein L5515_000335 [Caenorhabditis briggsae]|uniref:Protein CBR-LIN-65 n=1 Tax=Caenorhabditis briggsae TaxID=6238 RepID=A0AAE9J1P9_CAEBR|nr:hypothetical protein L5515_000335 [Caenorhabditis briggsae]